MQYNRFLPLIIPGVVFLFLELFYFYPKLIYVSLVFVLLLFLFAARQFVLSSEKEEKSWNILILPSVFTINLVMFSTLVSSKFFIQFLFFLCVVFLYYCFRTFYFYLIKTGSYKKYSLENISSYGNFLAFYFLASSVYGLQSFLNAPLWLLMLFLLVFIALIVYQTIWVNQINLKEGMFFLLLIDLILLELAWSISFLTLSYYILGLVLTISYYILIGLIRFYLLGILNRRHVKLYLVFGFSSILFVLLTARWL